MCWERVGKNPFGLDAVPAADHDCGLGNGEVTAPKLNETRNLLWRQVAIVSLVIVKIHIAALNPEQVFCVSGFCRELCLGDPIVRLADTALQHPGKLGNGIPFLNQVAKDGFSTDSHISAPTGDMKGKGV